MSVDTDLEAARTAYGREMIAVYADRPTRAVMLKRMAEIATRYVATRKRITNGKDDR